MPSADNLEPLIGQVLLFAGKYAPANFLPCDGRSLQITHYMPLYALLGTTYGGDGNNNFNLPNFPNLAGCLYIIGVNGMFPPRS